MKLLKFFTALKLSSLDLRPVFALLDYDKDYTRTELIDLMRVLNNPQVDYAFEQNVHLDNKLRFEEVRIEYIRRKSAPVKRAPRITSAQKQIARIDEMRKIYALFVASLRYDHDHDRYTYTMKEAQKFFVQQNGEWIGQVTMAHILNALGSLACKVYINKDVGTVRKWVHYIDQLKPEAAQ